MEDDDAPPSEAEDSQQLDAEKIVQPDELAKVAESAGVNFIETPMRMAQEEEK